MISSSCFPTFWINLCYKKFDNLLPYVKCQNITGGRLNKKDGLTRYGDSHVKDKTS